MEKRLGGLFLWTVIFYLVFGPLRDAAAQGSIERLLMFFDHWPTFLMLTTSFLSFSVYIFGAYLIFFYAYPKRLWKIITPALALLIIGAVAFRFILQEKITLALFGISNYFDYTLKYYFFDNLYYAIVYSAFGIIVYLVRYNNYREQQRQAAEIENQKTQLSLLRSQMKPHFIFNTLNNVYALAHEKSEKALTTIDKLSKLLRYSLYEKRELVPIKHEWSFMEDYIELQELRLAYQPAILYDVPQQLPDIQILPFSLIPFIENLFKHGELRYAHTPARIHLYTDSTHFHFRVSNNVRKQEKDKQGGIGLENTKQRLALYYGSNHQLHVQDQGNSYIIALQIPLNQC